MVFNKQIKFNLGKFIVLLTILVFPAIQAFAADSYKLLAPLPNLTIVSGSNPLGTYLPIIFNLAIGLSAVFAVLMIVIGGLQYISSDAIQKKSEGKERIKNAVISLVLVIGSWLILNTINPNLLDINLVINPATASNSTGTLGTLNLNGTIINLNTNDQLVSENWAATKFAEGGFTIKSSGNCTDPTNPSCTSVAGMHSDTVAGLIALRMMCGSNCEQLVITGGTEVGHAEGGLSHESGFKADISNTQGDGAAFNNFIGNLVQLQNNVPMTTGGFYNISVGPLNYQVHPEGDHMDIVVIPQK
jgi:hypothetical protein